MSTVILHIGVAKTGSTAIQHTLSCNIRRLKEAGIIYPRIPDVTRDYGLVDHNRLAYAIFDGRPIVNIKKVAKYLKDLADFDKKVILSAEVFYMRPFETDFSDYAEYITCKKKAIKKLAELLTPFGQTKIVCYIRRQDLWFESLYNEHVKHWKHEGKSFETFLEGIKEYHFTEQLNLWADIFGKDNIIIRPYEKKQLKNGNVVDDFISLVGLKSGSVLDKPPGNSISTNRRISRDVLEFQKILYKINLNQIEKRIYQKALWKISDEILTNNKEPVSWQSMIGTVQKKYLIDKYSGSNYDMAKKYLGREDGILFYEKPEWDGPVYPGLKIECAVEILFRLEQILETPSVRFERLILKLRHFIHRKLPFFRPLLSPVGRYYQKLIDCSRFGYQ